MKFKYLTILIGLIAILISCKQEKLCKDVKFSIHVNDVKNSQATITITHTGTNRDQYYVLLIDDLIEDVNSFINDFIIKSDRTVVEEHIYNQRKKVITYTRLLPNRDYTVIAFCIDDSGNIKGIPENITFTTQFLSLANMEDWQIIYLSDTIYRASYCSQFQIDINASFEHILCEVIDADTYNNKNLISILVDIIETYHASGKNPIDYAHHISQDMKYNHYCQLSQGDYYFLLIGLTPEGDISGHYAVSDCIHIEEYPPLPIRYSIIGGWQIQDARGNTKDILVEYKDNQSITILGLYQEEYVIAQYDAEQDCYTLCQQHISVYKDEYDVLLGCCYEWAPGSISIVKQNENDPIAEIVFQSNTSQPHWEIVVCNDLSSLSNTMGMLMYYSYFYFKNTVLYFPISLTAL